MYYDICMDLSHLYARCIQSSKYRVKISNFVSQSLCLLTYSAKCCLLIPGLLTYGTEYTVGVC